MIFEIQSNIKVNEEAESQRDDEELEDDDNFEDQDFQPDLNSPRSSLYAYERPLRSKNEMEVDEVGFSSHAFQEYCYFLSFILVSFPCLVVFLEFDV